MVNTLTVKSELTIAYNIRWCISRKVPILCVVRVRYCVFVSLLPLLPLLLLLLLKLLSSVGTLMHNTMHSQGLHYIIDYCLWIEKIVPVVPPFLRGQCNYSFKTYCEISQYRLHWEKWLGCIHLPWRLRSNNSRQ